MPSCLPRWRSRRIIRPTRCPSRRLTCRYRGPRSMTPTTYLVIQAVYIALGLLGVVLLAVATWALLHIKNNSSGSTVVRHQKYHFYRRVDEGPEKKVSVRFP